MNGVVVGSDNRTARISGGARAVRCCCVTDPLGVAAVTGSVGAVGMAGLTLGGGYGPLIGRFGLALDNLLAAEVVLADGRIVIAKHDNEEELFWALRGGGGNFGVVTAMRHRLHDLPSVRSGMLLYPFSEAKTVLRRLRRDRGFRARRADGSARLRRRPGRRARGHGRADVVWSRRRRAKRALRRSSSLERCSPALWMRHPMGPR